MANATITLPDGTQVQIEGSPKEVARILALYGKPSSAPTSKKSGKKKPSKKKSRTRRAATSNDESKIEVDLAGIVNMVKNCDDAEKIEIQILDKRSVVNRTLLPLYIVHEHFENKYGLTSGEVSKITTELGVPVSQPSASRTLSGNGSKYVVSDGVRVKGVPSRYKLSRRGVKYLKAAIDGTADKASSK